MLASVPGTDQAAEAVLLAQVPQTARVSKKETKAPDVAFQGDPQFTADREDHRAARRQHRQGRVQGRRHVLHVLPGRLVRRQRAPPGRGKSPSSVPQEIYQIPVSSPSHHVTYVTIEDDDDDEWVTFAAAAGYTGMMVAWGCAVWGAGYYYPPYWGYGGYYPYYYPHFADLRILGVVQPVDRRLRPQRRDLRSVWRRRRRRALQPAHRNLCARRGGVRSVRRARRRAGLQPAHRNLRVHAAGLERLRQLGLDLRAARRRLGEDQSLHEQSHRQHDAHDAEPTKGRPSPVAATMAGGRASATAATSTRARTATSIAVRTAPGRSTTTAAGRIPTGSPPATGQLRPIAGRPIAGTTGSGTTDRGTTNRTQPLDRSTRRSTQSGFGGTPRRHAAHQGLLDVSRRHEQSRHGQLPRWRRHVTWWRRQTAVVATDHADHTETADGSGHEDHKDRKAHNENPIGSCDLSGLRDHCAAAVGRLG